MDILRSSLVGTALAASTVLVANAPAAAQQDDPFGEHTYDLTVQLANELVELVPATDWAEAVEGEAADLVRFVGEDRLLVGVIETDRNAAPSSGPLYLFDATDGDELWEYDRRDIGTRAYTVLTTEPLLLLYGAESDGEEAHFTAIDLESGRRVWEESVEGAQAHALVDGGTLVLLDRDDDRWRLRAIDILEGEEAWEVEPDEDVIPEDAVSQLLPGQGEVTLVGAALQSVSLADGSVLSTVGAASVAEGTGAAVPLPDGHLFWNAASVVRLDRATGTELWSAAPSAGEIQSVSVVGGGIVMLSESAAGLTLTLIGASDGAPIWAHPVDRTLTSPVAAEDGLLLYATDATLVGLDGSTGTVSFEESLRTEMAEGSPSGAEVVGMPDVVRTRPGTLLLSRERAGIAAFDLPSGQERWFQPHVEADVPILRYTADGRYAYVYEARLTQAQTTADQLAPPPPRMGIGTGAGVSPLLVTAQRDYEAARTSYDALGAGASDSDRAAAAGQLRLAAEQQIVAAEIDIAMGQMAAAADFAGALVGVASAIRQYMVAQGRQGLVDRAQLAMQSVLSMQQRLFQSGYYVRPYYVAGRGRGVTLVDPETGLRSDVLFSPHNQPSIGYGVDLPTFALSPSGRRLAVVGISMHPDDWERRGQWGTRVPSYSVLTYDVGTLEWAEDVTIPVTLEDALYLDDASVLARQLEEGADPNYRIPLTGQTLLYTAVGLLRRDHVTVLLEHGADPTLANENGGVPMDNVIDEEMRDVLIAAGAPNPETDPDASGGLLFYTDPLFVAVSASSEEMIRDAVANGSSPNLRLDAGETILYLAVALDNPDTVRLLVELGADVDVENDAGDSPLDAARSDAVREALGGGR